MNPRRRRGRRVGGPTVADVRRNARHFERRTTPREARVCATCSRVGDAGVDLAASTVQLAVSADQGRRAGRLIGGPRPRAACTGCRSRRMVRSGSSATTGCLSRALIDNRVERYRARYDRGGCRRRTWWRDEGRAARLSMACCGGGKRGRGDARQRAAPSKPLNAFVLTKARHVDREPVDGGFNLAHRRDGAWWVARARSGRGMWIWKACAMLDDGRVGRGRRSRAQILVVGPMTGDSWPDRAEPGQHAPVVGRATRRAVMLVGGDDGFIARLAPPGDTTWG